MPQWNTYSLQDAHSPLMEEFVFFHDFIMTILVFIGGFVLLLTADLLWGKDTYLNSAQGHMLEGVWTLVPTLILVQVSLPSLIMLYTFDEASISAVTLKIMGHQWYWSYEYSDFLEQNIEMDAYMIPSLDLQMGDFRLLETDNRPVLPYFTQIRFIISSADVLHSWALPKLGLKADATPGRLNQLKSLNYLPGVLFGQCSEICGANHSFMPISIEFITTEDFLMWVSENTEIEN